MCQSGQLIFDDSRATDRRVERGAAFLLGDCETRALVDALGRRVADHQAELRLAVTAAASLRENVLDECGRESLPARLGPRRH